ncbi:MAG: hypothetical protein Q9180_005841, partial [Flavoplaca navasiana]
HTLVSSTPGPAYRTPGMVGVSPAVLLQQPKPRPIDQTLQWNPRSVPLPVPLLSGGHEIDSTFYGPMFQADCSPGTLVGDEAKTGSGPRAPTDQSALGNSTARIYDLQTGATREEIESLLNYNVGGDNGDLSQPSYGSNPSTGTRGFSQDAPALDYGTNVGCFPYGLGQVIETGHSSHDAGYQSELAVRTAWNNETETGTGGTNALFGTDVVDGQTGFLENPATGVGLVNYELLMSADPFLGYQAEHESPWSTPLTDNTGLESNVDQASGSGNELTPMPSNRLLLQPNGISGRASHSYPASATGEDDFYPSFPSNVTGHVYPASDPGRIPHTSTLFDDSDVATPDFQDFPTSFNSDDRASEEPSESIRKKRKASYENYNRVVKARNRPPVPEYEVKVSRTSLGPEVRYAKWLLSEGKTAFDSVKAAVYGAWGVGPDHDGSCILVTEGWKRLDPAILAETFTIENYPNKEATRMGYRYDGYSTTFARALAFFRTWPRRGVDLDSFNGSDGWSPMEASHQCHHGHCVVHAVLEAADINQERKQCHEQARLLRTEGRRIPATCQLHDPPCLMQHASLQTAEAYYIQFSVVAATKGITLEIAPKRPQRPRYRNFQIGFPLSEGFEAIHFKYTPPSLAATKPNAREKPTLQCKFCGEGRGFGSVVAAWAHIRKDHNDVDDADRLKEVTRMGDLWRTYQYASHRYHFNARNSKTFVMLEDLQKPDISWEKILHWDFGGR